MLRNMYDNIAPTIDKVGIKVWIDGESVDVLMKQQIKEYYEETEYGIAYYITVSEPKKTTTLPYKIFKMTLSKILCKWKQDSVVSLFLYLDSVFKNKHKLVHNQAPV